MGSEQESRVDGQSGHQDPIRSISRAFRLLNLFDKGNPRRHVRDLADLSGIPRTSVLRLLGTLESHAFVTQVAESTYQVGPGALRWFRVVQDAWTLPDGVMDVLRALRDQTGESVNVYVRQGAHRVSIGQAEGAHTVRSVVRMGVPLPLESGSSGTVLLTHAPASVARTAVTTVEVDLVRQRIDEFRQRGYVVSHGERESGASSLSLPIRCSNGAVAALSISGPTSRFDEQRIGPYLAAGQSAVQRIASQGLGPVEALLTPLPGELDEEPSI